MRVFTGSLATETNTFAPMPTGLATAELCFKHTNSRAAYCTKIKQEALKAFQKVGGIPTGDQTKALPSTLNVSVADLDSEAMMLALRDIVAISNGSACTSQNYTTSHVLTAMGLPENQIRGALRLSWCHLTLDVPWDQIVDRQRHLYLRPSVNSGCKQPSNLPSTLRGRPGLQSRRIPR